MKKPWLPDTASDPTRVAFPEWLKARRDDNRTAKVEKRKEPYSGVEKTQSWLWDLMTTGTKKFNVHMVTAQKERVDAWHAENDQLAEGQEGQGAAEGEVGEEEEEEEEQEPGDSWDGDPTDDDDNDAASDGEADPDGTQTMEEEGARVSPTPSVASSSSHDSAEEADPLIAEARKYPALKRKADELEAVRQSLRQDVEAEKDKEAAAAEAAAVDEEVARVEYETVRRIKRAKIRQKYIVALEQRARSQHPEGALMCECGCKTTSFGEEPLDIHDMEVDHDDERADGGADDPGIDGLNLYTKICHGRKTRARALERIRARRHQA
jgi:hypothetical protein